MYRFLIWIIDVIVGIPLTLYLSRLISKLWDNAWTGAIDSWIVTKLHLDTLTAGDTVKLLWEWGIPLTIIGFVLYGQHRLLRLFPEAALGSPLKVPQRKSTAKPTYIVPDDVASKESLSFQTLGDELIKVAQNIRMGFDPFVGVIAKENLINGFLTASAPYFLYYYGIAREWGIKDDGELEYYFDKPHHIDEIDRFAGLLEKFGNRVKLFQ